jgi:transketolase
MNNSIATITEKARLMRQHILKMAASGKTSHVGSALSCADILAVLYFGRMNIDPKSWNLPLWDRFILSKGHGAMAWYAALAEAGFFPKELLNSYSQDGSLLGEHPHHGLLPGITVSTGSLGHGLPVACGMALAARIDKRSTRTFVLISDGECNEGSIWEAAMWASHERLDNLIVIIDDNHMQAMGPSRQISGLDPLSKKWEAFGWQVFETDGHDITALMKTAEQAIKAQGGPRVIIARTVLGQGISFMENDLLWHYQIPSNKQVAAGLKELEHRS